VILFCEQIAGDELCLAKSAICQSERFSGGMPGPTVAIAAIFVGRSPGSVMKIAATKHCLDAICNVNDNVMLDDVIPYAAWANAYGY
jgi:hypothetical protein